MYLQIIFLALGLTMDTFAVGVAAGVSLPDRHITYGARFGATAALTQVVMLGLGWAMGRGAARFFGLFGHWVAFIVLCILGVKMIKESFEIKEVEEKVAHLGVRALLLLAVATSIDALSAGFGLSFVGIDIKAFITVLAAMTFTMGILGILIGKRLGDIIGKRAEVLGGIILIIIGLKILTSHLL